MPSGSFCRFRSVVPKPLPELAVRSLGEELCVGARDRVPVGRCILNTQKGQSPLVGGRDHLPSDCRHGTAPTHTSWMLAGPCHSPCLGSQGAPTAHTLSHDSCPWPTPRLSLSLALCPALRQPGSLCAAALVCWADIPSCLLHHSHSRSDLHLLLTVTGSREPGRDRQGGPAPCLWLSNHATQACVT